MERFHCINENVAMIPALDSCDASCFVCHHPLEGGDNFWDMVARPRLFECPLQDSLSNWMCGVRLCWLALYHMLHMYVVMWERVTFLTLWMVTKLFYSTRLETRTKESNTFASSFVMKLVCTMKVITEMLASVADWSTGRGLSMSKFVRTRKMVNYACEGWSLGKLRWRLVAILTCKSFVKHWYRGERLIEPSSSWFLPKFPSG